MQRSAVIKPQAEAALWRRAARVYASARTPEQVQTAHRYLRLAARRLEPRAGAAQEEIYAALWAEGLRTALSVMAEETWLAILRLWVPAAPAPPGANREGGTCGRRLH